MSKWRVKGFVQDSDEEEDDFETWSIPTYPESQCAADAAKAQTTAAVGKAEKPSTTQPSNGPRALDEGFSDVSTTKASKTEEKTQRTADEATSTATQHLGNDTRFPGISSPVLSTTEIHTREGTGSPDPLQPTPRTERVSRLLWSSQILGAASQVTGGGETKKSHGNCSDTLLAELGIAPFSDTSDSELSDPPTDLDESAIHEVMYTSPTRRSTVQVVIPSSTALRNQEYSRQATRSFRQRKPIQLHPYLLEGERYRRDLQGRGVKPVARATSPPPRTKHNEPESQEQEFNPYDDHIDSSPVEIPVSTPTARRHSEKDTRGSVQRVHNQPADIQSASAHRNGAKRRRLDPTLHKTVVPRGGSAKDNGYVRTSVWDIPQSPPESSSPPVHRPASTSRLPAKAPAVVSVPELPTPSTSSSLRAPPDDDSDVDPIDRRMRRSGQRKQCPILIPSDGSSSDSEAAETQTRTVDKELQKVGKKIRGVLPASWLRLDQQAQKERERRKGNGMDTLQSPRNPEAQRGVAQRVNRWKERPQCLEHNSVNEHFDISDDPDATEHHQFYAHANQSEKSSEAARLASETAAMLNHRYAAEDSDNMEDDHLHLFTLGGSSRKRKAQTSLLDGFAEAKKKKEGSHASIVRSASLSKRYTSTSRKARKTPPPAMSVLDVDQSPSDGKNTLPLFLRVAKRQARRRPDRARQRPTNKHIKLHTAHDTDDANSTLHQWRGGDMKPKRNVGLPTEPSKLRAPLQSLLDLGQNQQSSRQSATARDIDTLSHSEETLSTPAPAHRPGPSRPMNIGSISPHRSVPAQDSIAPIGSRARLLQYSKKKNAAKKNVAYRTAQLEAPETGTQVASRKNAFERGLQRVDRQFNLQLPLAHISRNPQIARFLDEDDMSAVPLPSMEGAGDQAQADTMAKVSAPRRRLVRKSRPQRVDIETREYRQPSEPVAGDYLKHRRPNLQAPDTESHTKDKFCLLGLDADALRFSNTFGISPFQDGTYFHEATFIGSGMLHTILQGFENNVRDLNQNAGLGIVDLVDTSIRCGPWEDNTFAQLVESAKSIWGHLTSENDIPLPDQESTFSKASRMLNSLVAYFSRHLSFHDPIDRNIFVNRMERFATSFLENIMLHSSIHSGTLPTDTGVSRVRPLTRLLVLCIQTRVIAQHPIVDHSLPSALATLITKISKTLVVELIDHISFLNDFIENNKRYQIREKGIQEADVVVEGVVTSMLILSRVDIPGISFWELASGHLTSRAQQAIHLMDFESTWSTLFTLLPFIEFNDQGILERGRRASFDQDNWIAIRALLQQLFTLYPNTFTAHSASLDDYVRSVLMRCHHLIRFWHWTRCEPVLTTIFDFFARNGLKNMRREHFNGQIPYLRQMDDVSCSQIYPTETLFHIFLKCLYIGIQGMRAYPEKKFRSVVSRLTPNHGRSHPKDQALDAESLAALTNHHDILYTLYKASPPACRPRLELIKTLVDHEKSHREACKIGVRAWANLASFQLSTDEPSTSAQPFAIWYKEIMKQTLKQYFLAKTEADDYLKSGVLGDTETASLLVRHTVEKNQEQVIATLRDSIAGMHDAVRVRDSQASLRSFLVDSDLVHLLELPHLQDSRLIDVIRDALGVLRTFASLPSQSPSHHILSEQNEESQDYGDLMELDDLELDELMDTTHETPSSDTFQSALWHLLSNAFGAETSPSDEFLMDCVDTWCMIARSQVSFGLRSWSFYLDPFGQVAWQQLRRTEQAQKFRPYFMASLLGCDAGLFKQHRLIFLTTLMVSLADRDSMLRFQHRLLDEIVRVAPQDPLMVNLPFIRNNCATQIDITAETIRTRRLTLISSILSNMRDDFHKTLHEEPGRVAELRGSYASILQDFMYAMKVNYQQLGSAATLAGAYVEFVQKVVQFLQQYTADICPVLDFFTNSVAFPLPAADPTYVVGRLHGYVPKLARPGITKQLSTFVQTVAQQAATGGVQSYLIHQLQTALCSDEALSRDRMVLRDLLLQGIFPVYVEAAFDSPVAFLIAQPIMGALYAIAEAIWFDIQIFDETNVRATCDSLLAISHAFIRNMEKLKGNEDALRQPHVLEYLCLMFQTAVPISSLLAYICGRCSKFPITPFLITFFEDAASFIMDMLHNIIPQTIPSYGGDATVHQAGHRELLSFSMDALTSSIKTNWRSNGDCIYFGHGPASHEVSLDRHPVEEWKAKLVETIETFLASRVQEQGVVAEENLGRDHFVCDIDV